MPMDGFLAGLNDSPYLPTFLRLLLALALGMFVGMERERRRKEAGMRTFAFAALLGAAGGMLGDAYAIVALASIGILVVLLNLETLRTAEGVELTTSAALMLTTFTGVLAGQGQTFTPTVLGVTTAALLAWKTPLAGFSTALTESELRSAVLLAIMAFVVYPILPEGTIDPGGFIDARQVWVTVILIAALGFLNYVLLKVYGTKGLGLAAFLGGLVNSTATVAELAARAHSAPDSAEGRSVYRGVLLATNAMLARNAIILGIVAWPVLVRAGLPLALMFGASYGLVRLGALAGHVTAPSGPTDAADNVVALRSPFSLSAALKFGAILLTLHVCATVAQHTVGDAGVYAVSAIGGLISSASATASAGALFASGEVSAATAAAAAILASLTSAFVNVPLVLRLLEGSPQRRPIVVSVALVCALGAFGAFLQSRF